MQRTKLRADGRRLATVSESVAFSSNGISHDFLSSSEVVAILDRAHGDLLVAAQHLPAGGELHNHMLRALRSIQHVHDQLDAGQTIASTLVRYRERNASPSDPASAP